MMCFNPLQRIPESPRQDYTNVLIRPDSHNPETIHRRAVYAVEKAIQVREFQDIPKPIIRTRNIRRGS